MATFESTPNPYPTDSQDRVTLGERLSELLGTVHVHYDALEEYSAVAEAKYHTPDPVAKPENFSETGLRLTGVDPGRLAVYQTLGLQTPMRATLETYGASGQQPAEATDHKSTGAAVRGEEEEAGFTPITLDHARAPERVKRAVVAHLNSAAGRPNGTIDEYPQEGYTMGDEVARTWRKAGLGVS